MTLGKPLRDEGSSGSDDERESKRLHQQLDAPNEDEQRAEAAKSAEVRAARVVMAEAEVVARAADLKLVTARKDMQYGKGVSSSEQSVLEESVRQARADAAVAKAREDLLRAELKALQLRRAWSQLASKSIYHHIIWIQIHAVKCKKKQRACSRGQAAGHNMLKMWSTLETLEFLVEVTEPDKPLLVTRAQREKILELLV
jgi:hypothetical protein